MAETKQDRRRVAQQAGGSEKKLSGKSEGKHNLLGPGIGKHQSGDKITGIEWDESEDSLLVANSGDVKSLAAIDVKDDAQFRALNSSGAAGGAIILYFYSQWSRQCEALSPFLESEIAVEGKGNVSFMKVI